MNKEDKNSNSNAKFDRNVEHYVVPGENAKIQIDEDNLDQGYDLMTNALKATYVKNNFSEKQPLDALNLRAFLKENYLNIHEARLIVEEELGKSFHFATLFIKSLYEQKLINFTKESNSTKHKALRDKINNYMTQIGKDLQKEVKEFERERKAIKKMAQSRLNTSLDLEKLVEEEGLKKPRFSLKRKPFLTEGELNVIAPKTTSSTSSKDDIKEKIEGPQSLMMVQSALRDKNINNSQISNTLFETMMAQGINLNLLPIYDNEISEIFTNGYIGSTQSYETFINIPANKFTDKEQITEAYFKILSKFKDKQITMINKFKQVVSNQFIESLEKLDKKRLEEIKLRLQSI